MRRVLCLLGLLCVVLLAACGPGETPVQKPAQEMNLTAEDLGRGFTLPEERGLEDLLTLLDLEEAGGVQSANMRTFISGTQSVSDTQVLAAVLVYDSSGSAGGGLQDIQRGFAEALEKSSGLVLQDLTSELAEQAYFGVAEVPDQGTQVYLLLFRSNNVVGMLTTMGPVGFPDEETVRSLGQKMAEKVPRTTAGQ